MKYIPQAAPFVMIGELVSSDEAQTIGRFTITADNIFIDNMGCFAEAGLVENMAQTAAAGTGFKASQNNEAPPVGFIGQIKNLSIFSLPKVGDTIETTITQQNQVMNAIMVMGEIRLNQELIARAEYKIFLQS